MRTAKKGHATARRQTRRSAAAPFDMRELVLPALLFAAAVIVYIPTLSGDFVWDDRFAIRANTLLRDAKGLWTIWTGVHKIPNEEHYWPVTYTVLWAQWNLGGGAAQGFHLLNSVLHGLIVVQIWRLARRIGIGMAAAAIGAALFALHPVHAESVAWAIGIKDLLAALFSLSCVEFYLRYEESGARKWLAYAAAAAVLAMWSKTSPVTLAAMLAVLIWLRGKRFDRRALIGVGVLAAITLGLAMIDMRVTSTYVTPETWPVPALDERLMESGWTFWLYVKNLLAPVGLSPIYPQWELNAANALNWLPLALAIAATLTLWAARKKIGRGPLACWLMYAVALAPVAGVVYISYFRISPAADRYQYFASIAPLVGAGVLAGRALEAAHASMRQWLWGLMAAVLIGAGALTWIQAGQFRNEETLYRHALRIAPDSVDAKRNLGTWYYHQKRYVEAETILREAVGHDTNSWSSVRMLGVVLIYQSRERDAADLFRDAVKRGCNDPTLLSIYTRLLLDSRNPAVKNPALALEMAQRSVLDPKDVDAHYWRELAKALAANGRMAEAADAARKAMSIAAPYADQTLYKELSRDLAGYEQNLTPQ